MKNIFLIKIFLIMFNIVLGQENFIDDYSFEEYIKCKNDIVSKKVEFPLKKWTLPTGGTSDYFNCCSIGSTRIPKNQLGYQEPKTGNGYVGLMIKKNYNEYVQTKLRKCFIKDSVYEISFYCSLANNSKYYTNNLGVKFSESLVDTKYWNPLETSIDLLCKTNICDTLNWVKIVLNYKAKGNEKYLILGGFKKGKLKLFKTKFKNFPIEKSAYYYIDDVSVIQIKEYKNHLSLSSQSNNKEKETSDSIKSKFSAGQKVILPSLTFKVNKWDLVSINNSTLDSLSIFLNNNPNLKINIDGFTDNIGTEESNIILSENRAKSVKDYLINKGIKEERITIKGNGSLDPLDSNNTEEGRARNRRVEIMIVK